MPAVENLMWWEHSGSGWGLETSQGAVDAFVAGVQGGYTIPTYYVANSGSDGNSGTSSGAPWQTIDHVAAQTFADGDSVLWNKGDVFRFATVTSTSQWPISKNLTVDAYGSGAAPVISGGKLVTSWTQGNTYTNEGVTSIQNSVRGISNYSYCEKITPGESGTVATIMAYIIGDNPGGSGTQHIEAVIYSDSGGNPGSLLATSGALAVTAGDPGTWLTFTFGSPPSVTSGTSYWIGLFGENTANKCIRVSQSSTGSGLWNSATTGTYPTPPSSFGTKAGAGGVASIYAIVTTTGSNVYSASLSTAPNLVTANGTALSKGSSTSPSSNQWYWSSSTLYVNLGGTDPGTEAIEAAQSLYPVGVSATAGVTIQNITLSHGNCQALILNALTGAFLLSGCTIQNTAYDSTRADSGSVLIQNCTAGGRVTGSTFTYLLNDGIWIHNTPNVQIDNNTMNHIGFDTSDVQSDGIQIEDTYESSVSSSGLSIHDNTIDMTSTYSVKGCVIVNSDPSLSTQANMVVKGNALIGGSYGVAAACSNLTIQDNVMLNQVTPFGGGVHCAATWVNAGVTITDNLIVGSNRHGIVIQDGSYEQQSWTISQNTIVNCARTMVYLGSPISGTIENNILWWTVQPSLFTLYIDAVATGGTGTLVCDYNDLGAAFTNYLNNGSTAYSTLAAWQSATGYDAHSIASDPLFQDTSTGKYTLQATSPALTAGTSGSSMGGFVPPTVSGSAPVGSLLTCTPATYPGGYTVAYQWTRDGSNIGGASSATYTTVTADETHAVGCTITLTQDSAAVGGGSMASSNSVTPTGGLGPTVIDKTGTSGTAIAQKTVSGWTSVSQKSGGNNPITQKTAAGYTKVQGH